MTQNGKKILIIRFNSIGDIVLTTPVIQVLSDLGYEVHFLMKSSFSSVLKYNPHVNKIHFLDSNLSEVISTLINEDFDLIVDLHNNFRSKKVCGALRKPVYRYKKERVGLWLLTNFGIGKFQRKHVVEKFLEVIQPLVKGSSIQSVKPQYFFDKNYRFESLPEDYAVIAVGAAYFTKQIPTPILIDVINRLQVHCVLIGGKMDGERAKNLVAGLNKKVLNLVGRVNISQSASIINNAKVVLAGDTGMMHIANALGTPVVAIFGSTHPMLGYSPYNPEENAKNIVIGKEDLSCRPCTKQGKHKCPKKHFKCMLELNSDDIIDKIEAFI